MKHNLDYDFIVIGGGLVGGAFALDLACQNPQLNIAIIDAKEIPLDAGYLRHIEEFNLDNRIYAITPSNVLYLKRLGVWPDESQVGVIKTMDVFGDFAANIILDKNLSHELFLAKTIEYKVLQKELYHKLKECLNISFIYDELSDIVQYRTHASVVGKKNNYKTALIVGADGANSLVRKISGVHVEMIDYEESGMVANFSCQLPHKNVAYQWFTGDGILAYLPLNGNRISIVWSTKDRKKLLAMEDEEFANLVATTGKYKLGQLKLITKRAAFPLRMYMLEKIYADRIVLIGDAAHTIHPLAGQGVNLGFKDAKMLTNLLSKVEGYQLIDSATLAKYNVMRKPHILQMQLTCHFLHRLFNSNLQLIKDTRNFGFNLVNSLPKFKKIFLKIANRE